MCAILQTVYVTQVSANVRKQPMTHVNFVTKKLDLAF